MTRDAGRQTLLYRSSLEQHEFRAANRPCVGHHQKYEFFRLLHRRYRLDGAFLAKCSGSGSSPRPVVHPTTAASGARAAAVATGALELPPLYLRATLRSKDRFCHA